MALPMARGKGESLTPRTLYLLCVFLLLLADNVAARIASVDGHTVTGRASVVARRLDAAQTKSNAAAAKRENRAKAMSQEAEVGITAQGTFTDSASELSALPAVANDSIVVDLRPESASQADVVEKMTQQLAALRTELKAAQAQATSVEESDLQRAELEQQVAALRTELEAAQLKVMASVESA